MSTRATYQFIKPSGTTVTYYIHHDGYECGAAEYLLRGLLHKSPPMAIHTLAERFVRANDRAEITDSHEIHGDTEYRYTVNLKTNTLKAEKRRPLQNTDGKIIFKKIFQGPLEQFVNEHPDFCGKLFPDGVFVPLDVPAAAVVAVA